MNMNRNIDDSARHIRKAASEWCVVMHDTEVDLPTRKMFVDWLLRSPEHIREFLEMARLWEVSSYIDESNKIDIEALIKDVELDETIIKFRGRGAKLEKNVEKRRVPGFRWMYAASFVLAIGLMGLFFSVQEFHFFDGIEYQTGKGEQLSVVLSDDSVVYLNTASKLTVEMLEDERWVHLIEGEVYFDISHDEDRPFLVQSREAVVKVLGTKFNVRRKEADTTVSVVEGKVSVSARNDRDYLPIADLGIDKNDHDIAATSVRLKKGQQTSVAKNAEKLEPKVVDTEKIIAWRERRLIFESEPLANVIDEFNRYNSLSLKINDRSIAELKISGTFKADSPKSLIDYLEKYEGVEIVNEKTRSHQVIVRKSQ